MLEWDTPIWSTQVFEIQSLRFHAHFRYAFIADENLLARHLICETKNKQIM
jgi:hypothetical protein